MIQKRIGFGSCSKNLLFLCYLIVHILRSDVQFSVLVYRQTPASAQTGLTVQVPLFIVTGERISVKTEDGSYFGRA
jgi:hypothetical protein